jgi:hypothetical protein
VHALGFVVLAAGSLAEPPLSAIVPGWDQVEIESYHGPEGYYLDSVSGALVRYYTGPLPDYIGVRCVFRSIVIADSGRS